MRKTRRIKYAHKYTWGDSILVEVYTDGYRQTSSYNAFQRHMDDQIIKGEQFCHVNYSALPRIMTKYDMAGNIRMGAVYVMDPAQPISIFEYYNTIGYDYKTKKLNGYTILQHIRYASKPRVKV
jgi:hypothetical protein